MPCGFDIRRLHSLRSLHPRIVGRGSLVAARATPTFSAVDGVLFSKDKKQLLVCPAGKDGEYAIPEGTVSIGHSAFNLCKLIKKITIPKSVTKLDTLCFSSCWFKSIVIPDGVKEIPYGCFMYSNSLENVTFSKDLTAIGNYAFQGCFSLRDITVPDKVLTIGSGAFYGSNMTGKLTLGESLISIGSEAFKGARPSSIYCRSMVPCLLYGQCFDYTINEVPLYVPRGSANAYSHASGWVSFWNILEYDVVFKGDVNGDNIVTVTDVSALINHILGHGSYDKSRCDIDANGIVNVTDVSELINILLN